MPDYTDEHARSGIDAALPPIETWPNQYPDYEISVEIPEYNAICPKTGLPDFGHLTIRYVPDRLCLELKSLKLYIVAYRNVGIFYENAVNRILEDCVAACRPGADDDHGHLFVARRDLLDDRGALSAGDRRRVAELLVERLADHPRHGSALPAADRRGPRPRRADRSRASSRRGRPPAPSTSPRPEGPLLDREADASRRVDRGAAGHAGKDARAVRGGAQDPPSPR